MCVSSIVNYQNKHYFLFLFFSFFVASRRRARDEPSSERVSARINDIFDASLPGIKKFLYNVGLDPFEMKDFHQHLVFIGVNFLQ